MSLNWDCPYRSNRSPVFARNMVASSQPLAVQAGINALKKGGNAVDAALATAITLTVVEPNSNGIGSDAFAIVWDGNQLHGLNASGRAPAALSPEKFQGMTEIPGLGWDAVTVPGAVSAWVELSSRFGQLPFVQLFEDAIHYASSGFHVGPKTGFYWKQAEHRFRDYEAFINTFMVDGLAPRIGDLMCLPDHASTLRKIADSQGRAFYHGELAEAMVADSQKHNGVLTMDDLARHQCDWTGTIDTALYDVNLHEVPPNGQGLMALIGLGILNRLDIASHALDSVDSIHLQIEATRVAYAYIERHLADIEHMTISFEELLEDEFLQARADEISLDRADPHRTRLEASPDTVYLTSADESGMMVSMIQSNYNGFGSGIVVPATGISMQNRGAGFVLEEGHPNQVGGGKRPYHTIIPGFVMQNGKAKMSFGVMGAHMQAQGHIQMMLRVFVHGQNPQAASDAPRWHLQEDGKVALEKGFNPATIQELERRGHVIKLDRPELVFGGAQLIYAQDDGYCGGSDHRKEGLVAGF
ncbi:gamma-glutamyltransferase family protein [Pseudomonadota bacterium]